MTIRKPRPHIVSYTQLLTSLTACALTLSMIGCDADSRRGGVSPLDSTKASTHEIWPGGSLKEWDGEGAVQSHTRVETGLSHGGSERGYAEGSYEEAAYDYDEAPSAPAEDYDSTDYTPGDDGSGSDPESAIQESALEGGEVDDNDDLEAFIAYLEGERELYGEDPSIEWLDVSERHLITVQDSYGVTVPDTRLTFWNEEGRVLQFGRTRADGRFAFFPNLFEQAGAIEVEAESPYGVSRRRTGS